MAAGKAGPYTRCMIRSILRSSGFRAAPTSPTISLPLIQKSGKVITGRFSLLLGSFGLVPLVVAFLLASRAKIAGWSFAKPGRVERAQNSDR
jgi:hypothetical protein